MNSHVFLVGFIIYALAMIWLGWYVSRHQKSGNDSNLLIVFYVQIMPDDLVMQLHRF
ncbi:Pantothenate:Na+ symporter (TC 2.A.21.1.1) [Klebsiella pneumoniae]|nr:Pantothenate:Na+ symporter (TC 2.A.21.1.1) [Klebsiella pneumoniae]